MNPHTYAQLYSTFHGSTGYHVHDNYIISIPIASIPFEPIHLLRFYKFDKVVPSTDRPLANVLTAHFKTESTCSVFEHGDTWTMLVGNKLIVYPHFEQTVYLFATPYFVTDPDMVDVYLKSDEARPLHKYVYAYKNAIVYLDKFDMPSPGERYWTAAPSEHHHQYRICILSHDTQHALALAKEWDTRPNVKMIRFKTKRRTVEPILVPFESIRTVAFPDESVAYTATVDTKQLLSNHPEFLIQDILQSYAGHQTAAAAASTTPLKNIGLVLQFPFDVGYEGCPEEGCGRATEYVALAVNGHTPSRVLYSRAPYDRYIEYNHVPALPWTRIGYDMSPNLPRHVNKVVIDSVTIGLEYRDAFFCLEYPVLETTPVYPSLLHTDCLLSLPSQTTLSKDKNVTILETFRYDSDHVLLHVKLLNFEHGLWCLSERAETDTYPKRLRPPKLVQEWLSFYIRNRNKKANAFNVTAVKLALVLARHKICFRMSIGDKAREAQISNREIVLHMDGEAVDFVNSVRLDEYREQTDETGGCKIM